MRVYFFIGKIRIPAYKRIRGWATRPNTLNILLLRSLFPLVGIRFSVDDSSLACSENNWRKIV